ncbi:hypothetical protein HT031_005860 [Scenedesmus sp. PABB004]|nr:hypothetical protein HT031_005860 [Scenedesmus sp. PABB004]
MQAAAPARAHRVAGPASASAWTRRAPSSSRRAARALRHRAAAARAPHHPRNDARAPHRRQLSAPGGAPPARPAAETRPAAPRPPRPAAPRPPRRARRVAARGAAPAAQAAAAAAAGLKADIVRLSGGRYGHDLDAGARAAVLAKVAELERLALPVAVSVDALAGTTWATVFTTSDGASSGKVGPFVAEVRQEFPAGAPGTYVNVSRLGLVSAALRGECRAGEGGDLIDLEFKDLALRVGPLRAAHKEFAPGSMRGHWRITFADADFRVFYSNKGNLFVLRRL